MSEADANHQSPYTVSVSELDDAPGTFEFAFVPKSSTQARRVGVPVLPRPTPHYVVQARSGPERIDFNWRGTPDDPGEKKAGLEREVERRLQVRIDWIERVSDLVAKVEEWAKELDWSTRRIEKRLDDSQIGKHQVPALLMQEGTCRVLLEPIARSAPGAEGVVDLYLMPAYDDIAVLFFYGSQWHVHYNMARGTNAVVPAREAEAMPLTKKTLKKVLAELTRNVA
jgi:hypothetical protein